MRLILVLLATFTSVAIVTPSLAQIQTGAASTRGFCSPAISGNRNTVVVQCVGGRASAKDISRILNKILANQIDPDVVMAKLDEILAAQSHVAGAIIAPNGIANGTGTLINPTVNNIGAIPRILNVADRQLLLDRLPRDKPIEITALMGDGEAIALATDIYAFLKANGFTMADTGISQGVFNGPVNGVHIRLDTPKVSIVVGANLPPRPSPAPSGP